MSFSGSPIWDLFGKQAQMLENSYNVSVRAMYDIPRNTHRNIIVALTQRPHLKTVLAKRFLNFTIKLQQCPKFLVKEMFNLIKHDIRCTTGYNLRNIKDLCQKDQISELSPNDAELIKYHSLPDEDLWKVQMIKEIIDTRFDILTIEGFSNSELDHMIDFLCTS